MYMVFSLIKLLFLMMKSFCGSPKTSKPIRGSMIYSAFLSAVYGKIGMMGIDVTNGF